MFSTDGHVRMSFSCPFFVQVGRFVNFCRPPGPPKKERQKKTHKCQETIHQIAHQYEEYCEPCLREQQSRSLAKAENQSVVRPALGEPFVQDPQPTVSQEKKAVQYEFSVPSGGPGSHQVSGLYQVQSSEPPPTPEGSPELDDLSTVTGQETPLGSEEPEGFVKSPEKARSDTEPPSEERAAPEEAEAAAQTQKEAVDNGPSPAELASQLDEVASKLEATSSAIPTNATYALKDLLPQHTNPYGDAYAMEAVLEPTLELPL